MPFVRKAAWAWGFVLLLLMWFPERYIGDLDLGNVPLQMAAFGIGALLLALSGYRRPSIESVIGPAPNKVLETGLRFRSHTIRVMAMLTLYAAILETGKLVAPTRHASIAHFGENTIAIGLTSIAVYCVVAAFLRDYRAAWTYDARLRRAAIAFRVESRYASMLRDGLQAAYAICAARDFPAEQKIAQIANLLDGVLGAEPPEHGEELLDIAFGTKSAEKSAGAAVAAVAPAPIAAQPGERLSR